MTLKSACCCTVADTKVLERTSCLHLRPVKAGWPSVTVQDAKLHREQEAETLEHGMRA